MKVLVVNGSPRGPRGNTDRIVQPFLEGAREAGATTEVVYLRDKEIKHCQGCFTCWTKTPGVCIHNDDMPVLLEKLRDSDVLVFATPLYIYTVTGLMKGFMDRMLPLAQPYIVQRGEHFTHPPRYAQDHPTKFVLISNCGFPERHHFSGLQETFRRYAGGDGLAGMICCAGGELLRHPAMREGLTWYLDAAREAGREVVAEGYITPETQAVLDRPLVEDPADYARMANAYWDSVGVERVGDIDPVPADQDAVSGTPLPPPQGQDTMRDIVAGMAMTFNPEVAGDMEAVIQFDVTGEDAQEAYYLQIADGDCLAYAGQHPDPMLTIHTPADVWIAVSRGELNGQAAFMAQKYTVTGDFGLLMKLHRLFSGR
jgi:putative NADPH-quinone reductase/putative sterol carrier protein